jgi:hypothetical protein
MSVPERRIRQPPDNDPRATNSNCLFYMRPDYG